MSDHKAIAILEPGKVDEITISTGEPGECQVLIKVEYSSLIPFDTYMSDLGYYTETYPAILGFNSSGTVERLGSGIDDLAVGDRVTAFTYVSARSKGMQEYTTQPRAVCAKIPDTLSLEQAATIPDNLVTAFYTLFNQIGLPVPPSFPATTPPPNASAPILVYGAGATSGQYCIQLLHAAGYKKIIATASEKNHALLRSLGATDTIDYHSPNITGDIARAAEGDGLVTMAVDCICAETTMSVIAAIIRPTGVVALLLPIKKGHLLTVTHASDMTLELPKDNHPFAKTVKLVGVRTFTYLEDSFLKNNLMPKIVPALLDRGIIKPNRVRLIDQGDLLERVLQGLDLLRNNKVSGEKVVIKVRE